MFECLTIECIDKSTPCLSPRRIPRSPIVCLRSLPKDKCAVPLFVAMETVAVVTMCGWYIRMQYCMIRSLHPTHTMLVFRQMYMPCNMVMRGLNHGRAVLNLLML